MGFFFCLLNPMRQGIIGFPYLCRRAQAMSIAFESDEQQLLERLRKMSDVVLVRFGKAARSLTQPRLVLGLNSRSRKPS